MQLLCILIFIGVAQCDNSIITPANFENLCSPNVIEYASYYQLSVQTSYITSCECMLSSNNYIQSGFIQIDQGSNDIATNLITQFKNGIGSLKNIMLGLQTDLDKDMEDKLNSVLYMTTSYYQKKEVTVTKTETTLGEVTDIRQAQIILTSRRCESDYINFMNDIATVKSKYNNGQSSSNNINKNQWASLVKQYYEARETIIRKTNVYTSIREAFLLGSGINLCEGSSNFDQSKLEIYKTDDLGNYFGKKDNNPSTLLCQTATQLYYIYKGSLTAIYLKSVVHLKCDLTMRITIWEQVNLVRANFEHMCKNIDMFIKTTQTEAESTYGADSENYKKIMITLYICVNKMLITAVQSTEVSYRRALNFNPDRSMIKSDYNKYKSDVIDKFYKSILSVNTNAIRYDARLIDQNTCSLPTSDMCLPQNTYSLTSNKLIFQSFICQANYLTITIEKTEFDTKTVEYWIFEKITVVQFKNSIVFSRCSATANKFLIINTAFYSYDLITAESNTPSTEVKQILDQISNDVIGTLCVHSLEIIEMSETIDDFIDTNSNKENAGSVAYKPGFKEYTGQYPKSPPSGSNSTSSPNGPSSTPTYPNQNNTNSTPSPKGSGNTPTYPNQNNTNSTPSPKGSGNTPTYPNQNNTNSTPSPKGSGNTPTYPNQNNTNSTPSPKGSGNTPTYPNQNNTNSTPSPKSPGSPPIGQGSPGSPESSDGLEKPTYPGSYPGSNPDDIDYSFITSDLQVTKSIENIQYSVECKIEKSLSNVEKKEQNEYTKVVIQSLKISQQIFQCNVEYLNSVVSDSIQFISKETTIDSDEYILALIILYRDTQEKLAIVSLTMEIPLKRTIYPFNTTEYIYVSQTVDFGDYMKSFYQHFEVNYEDIYNNQNDAELFLKNSMTQFNVIYEKVVKAIQSVEDDSYKQFLLIYLQKTLTVYEKTSDYFKEQIVQTNDFITKSGDKSICALHQEIKQRMETITVMYSAVLIKCYQYSKDTSSITIYNSEYDIVSVQTQVVSSYTTITSTSSSQIIEIEIST